jgi:branched-chain amino acid transport system substrate-binding protein
MKTHARIGLILAIVVSALALTSATASGQTGVQVAPQTPPAPGFQVKLALILPLSGPVQSYGESIRDGALLAIQEAQAAGWDIETVFADTQCDAEAAVAAANQVIFTDTVKYIVGAVCSSASIPISEIAEANHVVQISPSSTNPQVTVHADGTNKEYVFRACFLDPFQGRVMAAVARDLGVTTAAVMYDAGNDYVSGLAGYFKNSFESMGGSVPVYEAYTRDDHDFSEILGRVATTELDVLFLPDYFGKVNEIAEQADAMGIQARFLGGDGWDSPELRLDLLEGAYFSTHFWAGDPRQIVVDFVQTYSAAYGKQPDALPALGYDATSILLQGIAEAGVDDPSVVKDEVAGITYEGVTDKIAFNQFGDPIKGAAIVKIESGQTNFFKWVAPVSRPAAKIDSVTDLGHTTTFTATIATGNDVTYTWAFGDGLTGSGQVVTHTYATSGAFTAVVTASNRMNSVTAQTAAIVRETFTLGGDSVVTTTNQVVSLASTPGLTQTLTITYTPQVTISHPAGTLKWAGVSFYLDASDEEGNPVTELSEPLTLTIRYSEDAFPPLIAEDKLEVRRYDLVLEDWVPLALVGHDVGADTITVRFDHFSEIALLGPLEYYLYLPIVLR